MHVPDGFLDAPTSVGTAVVAAGVVGACLVRSARRELDDRSAPLAGLVAVFIFAAQMITFPVGAGTSGHLLGGVLAAVLVGPATATLCLTVVLVVQAFLFADGGVSALGTNVLLDGASSPCGSATGSSGWRWPCCRAGCPASASPPASAPWSACPRRRWPSSGSTPSVGPPRSRWPSWPR